MARIVVVHRGYGCDTGCCGHVVEVDGEEILSFHFSHPGTSDENGVREYVRGLVTQECGAEHVADIDWDNCIVVDD